MERKQKKRNSKKVLLCICGCVVLAVSLCFAVRRVTSFSAGAPPPQNKSAVLLIRRFPKRRIKILNGGIKRQSGR